MELEIPPSPPPLEATLAARRAKRQAILAKYTGASSVAASPSPGPGFSSAVQPPNPVSRSDPVSQTQSFVSTPGVTSEVDAKAQGNGTLSQLHLSCM
jgi:serine/threonine-protein kinase PRP4